jgi:hypothetical protein
LLLDVGNVALVDVARPATFVAENPGAPWNSVTILLPRQSLMSHLGFEPHGGLYRRHGTTAGRLLFDLIRNSGSSKEPALSAAESYMQMAVYDLVGALFAPADPMLSRHADKLFTRIRRIIADDFADPALGPCEVAAQAGISLRYLQKLFTSAARPAANSFIRSVSIRPRVFCSGERHWAAVSRSARSLTRAAFTTTHILQEDFAIDSVTHRARIPSQMCAPAMAQRTLVPTTVRHQRRRSEPPRSEERL